MRKFLLLAVTLLIIAYFVCVSDAQAQRNRKSSPRKSPSLTVDQQAEQQARAFWNARITNCGGDFYTRDRNYIHQFRNTRIEVRNSGVSTADRMNGIEYRGATSFKTGQSRTFSTNSTLYQNNGWSSWSEGFTSSMGGVGLEASLKKENGRWSVVPSLISQAGVLKAITCKDALNPVAAERRAKEEALNAADAEMYRNAPEYGIHVSNSPRIPIAMLRAMYDSATGQSPINTFHLKSDGGWVVIKEGGYPYGLKLPDELTAKLKEINFSITEVSFTADGGWIIIYQRDGGNTYLWESKNIPQGLSDALNELQQANPYKKGIRRADNYIRSIEFNYSNGWVLLYGKASWACECSDEIQTAISQTIEDGNGVKQVVFSPNGGYVILYGDNGFIQKDIPKDANDKLTELSKLGKKISQIAFAPNGAWVIEASR